MTSSSANTPRKSKSWVYDLIEVDYDDEKFYMCKICGAVHHGGRNTKFSKTVYLSYHLFKYHPEKALEVKTRHFHENLRQEELNLGRQN